MKILFVLENYYPMVGGAEVLFQHLCEGLAARGHTITVITTRLPGGAANEIINGVELTRVRTPRLAARHWFTLLAIGRAIRLAGESDLIHTTTYNGAFPAWLAARMRRKKCVITVLEVIGKGWKEMTGMNFFSAWLHRFLEHIIVRLGFSRYIVISQFTRDCLKSEGVPDGLIDVIYPGIDYQLFDPGKANRDAIRQRLNVGEEFVYFYYGRPGISKGVEYLVEAVPLISDKIATSKLIMLLAREPADRYVKIMRAVDKLKQKGRLVMVDPVPRNELPSYIAAADCVVVPSLSEGFGFSAVEAGAMERPVVASNVASLPEVVSGTYFLIEPKSAAAIALGVEAVYNNRACFREKKIFKWSDCIDQYEKLDSRLSGAAEGD